MLSEDGCSEREIRATVEVAKHAFNMQKFRLKSALRFKLRKSIVKMLIWSVLLYGAETWTLRIAYVNRLESGD